MSFDLYPTKSSDEMSAEDFFKKYGNSGLLMWDSDPRRHVSRAEIMRQAEHELAIMALRQMVSEIAPEEIN